MQIEMMEMMMELKKQLETLKQHQKNQQSEPFKLVLQRPLLLKKMEMMKMMMEMMMLKNL